MSEALQNVLDEPTEFNYKALLTEVQIQRRVSDSIHLHSLELTIKDDLFRLLQEKQE